MRGLSEKPGPYGDCVVDWLGLGLPPRQPTLLLALHTASADGIQHPQGSPRLLSLAAFSSSPELYLCAAGRQTVLNPVRTTLLSWTCSVKVLDTLVVIF